MKIDAMYGRFFMYRTGVLGRMIATVTGLLRPGPTVHDTLHYVKLSTIG